MKLVIASNNQDKIREIRQILDGCFESILSQREAGIDHETVEDGKSFAENALKKAKEICALSGCAALADDSGICVDALGGAPGIFSARFAGVHGDNDANNRLLLEKMQNQANKKAHYTCAIALVFPDGGVIQTEGIMPGEITLEPRGNGGFGYDPLFFLPQYGCTAAQLSAEEKNKISHRSLALKVLLQKLEEKGISI